MEAIEDKVGKLMAIDLGHNIPTLQGSTCCLNYVTDFDSNFEDNGAYITGMNRFIVEAATIKQLNDIVEEGRTVHATMLYTWRSLTRTLPAVTDDTRNKNEIYECSFQILKQSMSQLINFYQFTVTARDALISEITKLCHPERKKEGKVSDGILSAIGMVLDMLLMLDNLRDAKTSVKNDFANYKRLETLMKHTPTDPNVAHQIASISMFLATPNEIMISVKKSLETIPQSQDIITDIVALACRVLDGKLYVTPEERHQFFRMLITSLSLLSGDKHAITRLEQKKKVPLSLIDRLLKDSPHVPLYGDMHTNMTVMLKKMNLNYEWSCLDPSYRSKLESTVFNICSLSEAFQDEHFNHVSRLTILTAQYLEKKHSNPNYELSFNEAAQLYTLGLTGLKLLSKYSYTLQEFFAFKLAHPRDALTMPDLPPDTDAYALATKYNFSNEEKATCAKIVFLIKSLCAKMQSVEDIILRASFTYIYHVLQELIHTQISEICRKAQKTKQFLFKQIVSGIYEIGADVAPNIDESVKPVRKGPASNLLLKDKSVSPLSTQLYMIKTMLNVILTHKELKKDIDSSAQSAMIAFSNESTFFRAMTQFSKCLISSSQLGSLYFKEFYLEISAGRHVHFPIDVSFPWMVVDYLLKSTTVSSIEFSLYVMDIYNDAAEFALGTLKKQFLFDEIDAEVVLCLQQMAYLLAEKVYNYMRAVAASTLLDKALKNEVTRKVSACDKTLVQDATIPYQSSQKYLNMCQQRSIKLLGRVINLNQLISQRLTINIKTSLESAISLLEYSTLESIVEFRALISVADMTHRLLSDSFDLPSFTLLYSEANNAAGTHVSRICAYITSSFICDIIPNFSFSVITQRFIRSPVFFVEQEKLESPPKIPSQHLFGTKSLTIAFTEYYSMYRSYLGGTHFDCIAELLGYDGIAYLLEELKKVVSDIIKTKLSGYVTVLVPGLPSKCVLPRASYGLFGVFAYYNANFESILKYKDLRQGVLHYFRGCGNAIAIVHMLEKAVFRVEGSSLFITAPQNGLLPKIDAPSVIDPPSTTASSSSGSNITRNNDEMISRSVHLFKFSMIGLSNLFSSDSEMVNIVEKASLLSQERMCCGLTMFDEFLSIVGQSLDDPVWRGFEPTNGVISIEECKEFHRVFSVLLYYMSLSSSDVVTTNGDDFGHGVLFCGGAIIFALKQHHRFEALDFVNHAVQVYDTESCGSCPTTSIAMNLSGGTLKSSTMKVNRTIRETSKAETMDPATKNKLKTVANMKAQLCQRKYIWSILAHSYCHKESVSNEVVKCFCPPTFKE